MAAFRFFQSKTFLTIINNISKNKLFQIKYITYYNTWFHDKSTNIIFILLVFIIILLFTIEIKSI